MAKFDIPVHSTKEFTYNKNTRTFSAFASDFGRVIGTIGRRIYDDACDYGFWLESEKTGKKILFVSLGYEYDNEGDLIGENFSSYCLSENPKDVLDLKVIIFND